MDKNLKTDSCFHISARSHLNRERCTQENLVLMSAVNHRSLTHQARNELIQHRRTATKQGPATRLLNRTYARSDFKVKPSLARHRQSPTNIVMTQKIPSDPIRVLRGCPDWTWRQARIVRDRHTEAGSTRG